MNDDDEELVAAVKRDFWSRLEAVEQRVSAAQESVVAKLFLEKVTDVAVSDWVAERSSPAAVKCELRQIRRFAELGKIAMAWGRLRRLEDEVLYVWSLVSWKTLGRGVLQVKAGQVGGAMRKGQLGENTAAVLERMAELIPGQTVSGAAAIAAKEGIGTSQAANKKLWDRHKK
ncbi:hypothetical protein ACFO5X_24280 [Seohaeicola nanhaiensis]|uniref:DUF222 domain-containing protein n=1 Tax=Seohaeicola nanhaiensis TaxID=1387282 RepID=A0ABV9KPU3_9RHOB